MRHGRLATALAVASFAGLAAAQAPPRLSPYNPNALPAVSSGTQKVPAVDLTAQEKSTPAEAKPANPEFKPATPAVTSTPNATPAGPVTTLPPTGLAGPCATPGVVAPNVVGYTAGGGEAWTSIEYLLWWVKDDQAPPLLTTGPATFPVGFLGRPGTRIVNDGTLDQGTMDGIRLRTGVWLDACRTYGLEFAFFCLKESEERNTFGGPVLARPFTDVNTGSPNSEFIAFPGVATGGAIIDNDLKFCGAALLARCNVCVDCNKRLDITGGLQYLELRESLSITETPRFAPTAPFPDLAGVAFVAGDHFSTRNRFYGPVVGFDATVFEGPFFAELNGSIAVGVNRQTIEITGYQRALFPDGSTAAFNGGLLALPGANIGRHTQYEISSVTQLGLNLGYNLGDGVTVFAGYSIIYWTNVVRPGRQIDPVLDINRIPNFGTAPPATSVRPTVPFAQTDFWAQGINLGVRFSW